MLIKDKKQKNQEVFNYIQERFLFYYYGEDYIKEFKLKYGTGYMAYELFIEDEDNLFDYNDWLIGEGYEPICDREDILRGDG